jgi:o-succinylbenzoate synthase
VNAGLPRVTRAEHALAQRPLRSQFSIFGGATDAVQSIFVRLTDECGCQGVGETTPMPAYSGVSVADAERSLVTSLLPAVRGVPATPQALRAAMDSAAVGSSLAKAAVDIACFDLLGKHTGVSVTDLLGEPVRDQVPLAWVLGYMPTERLLEETAQALAAGYRTVKLKVGSDARRDIEAVRAVRAAWPSLRLRIDANQGYDFETALKVCARLDDVELELLEQPIPADAVADLARLRAAVPIPIEADESLQSVADARALIAAQACDVFNLKILKPGGLTGAAEIVAIAQDAGIPVMIGSMPELGVATAAGFHLARTLTQLPYACELMGPQMVESDVVSSSSVRFSDGVLSIADDVSGLGVEVELPWQA